MSVQWNQNWTVLVQWNRNWTALVQWNWNQMELGLWSWNLTVSVQWNQNWTALVKWNWTETEVENSPPVPLVSLAVWQLGEVEAVAVILLPLRWRLPFHSH